jgi:virginiamycin B lyase
MNRRLALSLIVIAIASAGSFLGLVELTHLPSCSDSSTGTASIMKSQLQVLQFGGVRKYKLPSGRLPNAITVESDGSVWFGEQALPGIAHFFANGTLVEYAWPFQYKSPLGFTYIWGIADWDGCVWATDQAGSQLVAVNPNSGRISTVKVSAGSFPYTITVGPDNSLWFTEIFASKLARLDNHLNLHEYPVPDLGTPGQVVFADNTLGYYVDTGNAGISEPGIYSFNPNNFSPVLIDPSVTKLIIPTSLALSNDGIWVAQHEISELAYYRFGSSSLAQFPTTPVSYVKATLPYFVAGNGSSVWFNEHYANRIGVIDGARRTLTEYSLSNPPANKTTQIDNALTFALGGDRVWFTELTAGYVGYVDTTYKPSFSLQPVNASLELVRGKSATVTLTLQGESERNLTVISTDSETVTAGRESISLNSSETQIHAFQGQEILKLTVSTSTATVPGKYELLASATDGLVCQGVYLSLTVLQ